MAEIHWSKKFKSSIVNKLQRASPEELKASFGQLVDQLAIKTPEEQLILARKEIRSLKMRLTKLQKS